MSRRGDNYREMADTYGDAWSHFAPVSDRWTQIDKTVRDPDLPVFTHATDNEFALRVLRGEECCMNDNDKDARGVRVYTERFTPCRRRRGRRKSS